MGIGEVSRLFVLEGIPARIIPYGSGHIHATFRVLNQDPGAPDYLLQQINEEVFKDVEGMMENISLVTRHVTGKLEGDPSGFTSLQLIEASHGGTWVRSEGKAWRMYQFLKGLHSYDYLSDPVLIRECGRGFGWFARQVADLPAGMLTTTIPGFHDIGLRLDQLEAARSEFGMPDEAPWHVVQELGPAMQELDHREIPQRITHNDTKCNNILFNDFGKAACVVDLDTVMPGKTWYDTGDSLRTLMTRVSEDAPVGEHMEIVTDHYRSFLHGYLGEMGEVMSEREMSCIPLSGAYMAFIMGVRFLTDHLRGDVYYKTRFRGHNILRARNQLTLAREIAYRQDDLEVILQQVLEEIN